VNGITTLGGTLAVSLQNGFMPAWLDHFDVLDLSFHGGTFSTLQLPKLSGTLVWSTRNLYATGVLSVVDLKKLPGDMNLDGQITAADLDLLEQALVNPGDFEAQHGISADTLSIVGDADESGSVDNSDLQGLLYELNHGTSFLAGSALSLNNSPAAVPEPNSLA